MDSLPGEDQAVGQVFSLTVQYGGIPASCRTCYKIVDPPRLRVPCEIGRPKYSEIKTLGVFDHEG
jgi:hypothetical protein